MLCSSSKLTKLYLNENQIGDEGLASLAGGMLPGGASGLEELRLSFNRFGDRGAQALADCWKRGGGRHLRHVLLASNRIGDAGAIAFAGAVDETPLLQVLTFGNAMGGNLIGDDGARALANSVVDAMPHMIELNLKLNPISPQTRQEIYSLLLNRNVLLIDLP
ncbi:hypothetical protein AB1Y20_022156 [Prymnesium parvum]|uniref:Uncharacterized protein n=1 Tax=Prymnesium parvum TaxID=97485 RepID=A0AB34JG18_PRYPA|mmetsp:Transcript_4725/g.11533  ORF Transcript_4725/g.11533 Transcript_4725/m.11533 type:complete len:163 (-) Transcript_4725:450-938(-)